MNIIEAAKAVLAEADNPLGLLPEWITAIEALRKAVAESEGMVLVPWQTLDDACELLELHGEHEHPDYRALKATVSAKVKP